jgi:uncharacterized membrane protein YhaH (DUF805 family)
MDWTTYLFRFEGRINRARFWFGLLYLLCGMMLLLVLGAGFGKLSGSGGSFSLNVEDIFAIVDPATYRLPSLARLPLAIFRSAATAALLWVYLALAIKRLHDRDKSGWWMVAFFLLPGLYSRFEDRLPDSYWVLPLAIAAAVLYLWGFIEMGFLRGSRSTNLFGPNPLPKAQSRPRGSAASAPRADGWDQNREIEFVPPSASPPGGMHVKRGS